MRGQYRTSGSARSFSHSASVLTFMPICSATRRWIMPASIRRFLKWPPKVDGNRGYGRGLSVFRQTFTPGKKATRLCRCGYLDDPAQACGRAPKCAVEYQSKISGPLFDRIDLHVDVPAVTAADLALPPPAESSADIAARVARARTIQTERVKAIPEDRRPRTNAELDGELLEELAAPEPAGRQLLTDAAERLRLSARGYHRVLRVARTLADLEGAAAVARIHVAEALSYRRLALPR